LFENPSLIEIRNDMHGITFDDIDLLPVEPSIASQERPEESRGNHSENKKAYI